MYGLISQMKAQPGQRDGLVALLGRAAHTRLLAQVRGTRLRMVQGVSEADCRDTVATLERIAANLTSID